MSRGLGKVQIEVIKYLEKNSSSLNGIVNALSKKQKALYEQYKALYEQHKALYKKYKALYEQRKNSVYRAIKRLLKRHQDPDKPESPGVIYSRKNKPLFKPRYIPKKEAGRYYILNTNHPDYLKYKNKK